MTQSELLNRVREWGETNCPGADGPLSYCDEFLTPVDHTLQWHPSGKEVKNG